MKNERRMDACLGCGEVREMAAKGLCFACYRAQHRHQQRIVDRHAGALRREHKKLFRAHASVMAGLADLGLSRSDIMEVKAILDPYLSPIQDFLNQASSGPTVPDTGSSDSGGEDGGRDDSEHENGKFTFTK